MCPDNSALLKGRKFHISWALHCSSVSCNCIYLNNLTLCGLSMKCHWIFKLRYLSKNKFSEYPLKERAWYVKEYQSSVWWRTWKICIYTSLFRLWYLYLGRKKAIHATAYIVFHAILNFLSKKDYSWWYLMKRITNKSNGIFIATSLTEQERPDVKKYVLNICSLNK